MKFLNLCIIFKLIKTSQNISLILTESTNLNSSIQFSSPKNAIHLILFPKYIKLENIKTIKIKENTILALKSSGNKIKINFKKKLLKIFEIHFKVERNICIQVLTLINKTIIKHDIKDIYPVPDFTVPFIAFSSCGIVLGLVFNLFVNKQWNLAKMNFGFEL